MQRIDIWVESAGLGHVTRQINLVDHLRNRQDMGGLKVRFLVDGSASTQEALARHSHEFVVRNRDAEAAFRELDKEWISSPPAAFILDSVGQDLNPKSHLVLADDQIFSVVVIDDPADRDVDCDLLINALPTLNRPSPKAKAKQSLRGVEYLILPVEYALIREHAARRDLAECRSGFAFFGGADLEDYTALFLDAVERGTPVERWTLLLGPVYENADRAIERVEKGQLPITVVRHVDNMAAALGQAHIAVLAAGNTLSEAAAVGTPAIALSQNSVQAENAKFFSAQAGVVDLGTLAADSAVRLHAALASLARDPAQRRNMSDRMMQTVDALGGRRIAEIVATRIKAQQ